MIIDHQDDLGTFLRQSAPSLANSEVVKEASWKEKPEMLDREFAVILVEDDGTEHRKLAMHDAGNTLASITYFLTRDHNLPDSAVKLASIIKRKKLLISGFIQGVIFIIKNICLSGLNLLKITLI